MGDLLELNESDRVSRLKRVYELAIKARDLEIQNLTSRNNFFMIFQGVLLAGLLQAQGNYTKTVVFCTCLLGVAVSVCQALTAAGAKFWQARWEQKVADTEKELLSLLGQPKYYLFSEDGDYARLDVIRNMGGQDGFMQRLILAKYSVGRMPIYVGLALSAFWFALLINSFAFKNFSDGLFDFESNNLIIKPVDRSAALKSTGLN